jgi:aryl-alcohol dehydrogenase (NADP+)
MQYKKLGSSELDVSCICLGTMTYGEQNTEKDAHSQLDYATSRGINFIDVAEMYPVPARPETQGQSEQFVGSWLKKQRREKLIIASKITGPGRGFDWIRGGPRISRKHINQAIDTSLSRLQTDYLDLYQVHWPDRNVPMFGQANYDPNLNRETVSIEEQLSALSDLVKAGKVRYVGLSNETPWGLVEFNRVAREKEYAKIVSIQNAYNLLNRSFESGLSEVCYHENVGMLAYSPLAFGWLSGKYIDPHATGRGTLFPGFTQRYRKVNVEPAVDEYCALAKGAGLSPATMALAYVRQRWFVTSTIIGATTLRQLEENIESANVVLDDGLIDKIEQIHLRYPNPAP